MAVVTPQGWGDARIDDAVLSDPAPLLAIAAALDERRAAALVRGGAGFHPGDDLRYSTVEACREILRAIVLLRASYVNPATPYADEHWHSYPDALESQYGFAGNSLAPFDSLVLDPPPPMPEPGDSDWDVGRYRAFLAWAKRSISAMHVVEAGHAWALGRYHADTDPPPASSFEPSQGGVLVYTGEWYLDTDVWRPADFDVAAGLVVANPAGIQADVRVVMRGGYANPGRDSTTGDWTINAAWFAGALGPVASATGTVLPYSTATILATSGTLSASGASLPPVSPDSFHCYARATLAVALDYAPYFRYP